MLDKKMARFASEDDHPGEGTYRSKTGSKQRGAVVQARSREAAGLKYSSGNGKDRTAPGGVGGQVSDLQDSGLCG